MALWLIIAVALGIAEAFTLTAALGLLGGAALLTAGVAALGVPTAGQLLVFAAASAVGILVLRPVARRHMLRPRMERFGIDALAGRTAYVVHEVNAHSGTVRLDGEEWTARSLGDTEVIPPGVAVQIMQIDGATAVVYPQE